MKPAGRGREGKGVNQRTRHACRARLVKNNVRGNKLGDGLQALVRKELGSKRGAGEKLRDGCCRRTTVSIAPKEDATNQTQRNVVQEHEGSWRP